MWIGNNRDVFLLRDMPFKNAVINDRESYINEVFGIAESSFSHVDLYHDYEDNLKVMLIAVFASNYTINLDGQDLDVSFGDCLITTEPQKILQVEPEFILTELEFYFTEEKQQLGSGSKQYEVTSFVRDEYRIKVFADSEEEAIEIAKGISPSKWEHLEIDTHIEQRTMIRMGRWGIFSAKESS